MRRDARATVRTSLFSAGARQRSRRTIILTLHNRALPRADRQENLNEASGFSQVVGGSAALPRCRRGRGASAVKEIRIGYQKNGVLVIARQQAVARKALRARGRSRIKWVEFTSGPPLLEAMNTGSVDFGSVGDTPPIFAQAAGATIVYVAGSADHQRAGHPGAGRIPTSAPSPI